MAMGSATFPDTGNSRSFLPRITTRQLTIDGIPARVSRCAPARGALGAPFGESVMTRRLLELESWRGTRRGAGSTAVAYARPALEHLEERAVMSAASSLAQGVGAIL